MTELEEKVPANSVPAAAVRRGGRALFDMIGRKEHADGPDQIQGTRPKLYFGDALPFFLNLSG
jgi:hypothetical protein